MFEAANDVTLLVPQDAGENQYTCWFQTRAPKWDRTNQQFAEKIRGDDIEFLRRAMFGCIGDFEFDSGDSVQALVTLGDRNRVRVAIDCDYVFAPSTRAPIARMPLPVPASSMFQPSGQWREIRSSLRKHIAVVACAPVPNAPAAGMIS